MKSLSYWVVSLVLIFSLLLSACATPKGPTPTPSPEKPAGPATAAPKGELTAEQQLVAAVKAAGETEVALWVLTASPIEEAFEAKYPFLKLKVWNGGVEVEPRMLEEYRAGKYNVDVLFVPIPRVIRLRNAGVLQEYGFPNVVDWPYRPKHSFWVNYLAALKLSSYNTRLVPPAEVPKTFEALADPKWRGRSAVSMSSGEWLLTYAYSLGDVTAQEVKWDRTVAFWKRVIETTRPRITTGFTVGTEMVASGDVSLFMMAATSIPLQSILRGAPLDFAPIAAMPDFGAVALPKNPPHPNAAKLLIHYLTSEEGSIVTANATARCAIHPGAAKKANANLFFASRGIEWMVMPDELATEERITAADAMWRSILGR